MSLQINITEQVSPKNVATIDNPSQGLTGNTYSKTEIIAKIDEKTTVNLQGTLLISDPAPTVKGFYFLSESGTYTNLQNLVAESGKFNIATFDGTNWELTKVTFPINTAKIETWTASSYITGSQVAYQGEVWEANANIISTEIPGISGKWVKKIGGLNTQELHNYIFPDDINITENYKGYDWQNVVGSSGFNNSTTSIIAPDFPTVDKITKVNKISFTTYATDTRLEILIIGSDNSNPTSTGIIVDAAGKTPVNNSTGTKTYNFDVDIDLPANSRLAFYIQAGYIYWDYAYSYKTFVTYTAGIFTYESIGIAFGYDVYIEGQKYKSWAEGLLNDPTFQNGISSIGNAGNAKDKLDNTIFKDTLSVNGNNFTATGWTYSSGKFVSTATGRSNFLQLNKVYNLNKRRVRIRIKPSSNADFRIYNRKLAVIAGTDFEALGGSMFGINFQTNKISMYEAYKPGGEIMSITDNVFVSTDLTVPYVSGHEYTIEIEYYETSHTIRITDANNGKTQEWIVNGAGIMDVGRQQGCYTFHLMAGSADFYGIEVKTVSDVDILIVGDSITEAIAVPLSRRWWKQMEKSFGNYVVTARGGQTIQDIIDKFDDDISPVKPKKIIYLLGANGGGTSTLYQQLKTLAENAGIEALFAMQPTRQDGAHVSWNNNLLSAVTMKSIAFKFNIATSTNNDGTTYDASFFLDGIHPNENGSNKMALRNNIDFF